MSEHLPQQPTFHIGPIPVYGDLILSPMAGYSDVPFRVLCREMGSAMSYTACILDDAVVGGGGHIGQVADFREMERPVAMQMLGHDAQRLLKACELLLKRNPDLFDLNLGCPARRVVSKGRGAALLREPERVEQLIGMMVANLPVPVTAKIRLGWDDDTRNYLEVARAVEQAGASAIAVHGRTCAQQYGGRADWEAIAEVKAAVSIPTLANGDVWTPADAEAIQQVTGCDAVLIGRGAIGNPWIFARRDQADVSYDERLRVMRRHLDAMVETYGPRMGVVLFRKHLVKYLRGLDRATRLREEVVRTESAQELLEMLERYRLVLE